MAKPKVLLMLDKDDITIVCGKITTTQLKKELNLTKHQLANFLDFGKLYKGKYILIEDK